MAFIALEMLFKPTVFFGLMNSPAIFQTITNKILQNLINPEEVVSFINNTIVGTEKEEKYNEIVEEVVKKLAKS